MVTGMGRIECWTSEARRWIGNRIYKLGALVLPPVRVPRDFGPSILIIRCPALYLDGQWTEQWTDAGKRHAFVLRLGTTGIAYGQVVSDFTMRDFPGVRQHTERVVFDGVAQELHRLWSESRPMAPGVEWQHWLDGSELFHAPSGVSIPLHRERLGPILPHSE